MIKIHKEYGEQNDKETVNNGDGSGQQMANIFNTNGGNNAHSISCDTKHMFNPGISWASFQTCLAVFPSGEMANLYAAFHILQDSKR